MNAAQALLHQIASEEYVAAWDLLDDDLQNAILEELERADTTPTHTEPIHRTDPDTAWKAGPVVGEQTMRRFGLVRDEPSSSAAAWAPGGTDEDRTVY
jgi:hypothetical protein